MKNDIIDMQKAKLEFEAYVNKFDTQNPNIERKIKHSYRVNEISNKIAKSLKLDNEQIQIANLIGLLHDIGRFEQYTKYKTYMDIYSVDHAKLGVEILEKNNYIRKYVNDKKYDELIKIAILNHNKYQIDENIKGEEEIFCKIIRDSDKLDIFKEAVEDYWDNTVRLNENISIKVFEDFKKCKTILNRDKKTTLDKVVGIISFIFDIYFDETFAIIMENDYINKIINRFIIEDKEVKNNIEIIRKFANEYIKTHSKK